MTGARSGAGRRGPQLRGGHERRHRPCSTHSASRSCAIPVDLERVETEADERELRELVESHFRHTRSERAEQVLEKWATTLPNFVKVFPREYKRALMGIEFGKANY
jgi:glutamate synthase domain-containing protein 3